MPKKVDRRTAERNISVPREGVLDWEGARVFLEIARLGSIRAASMSLHQSINALRRRIEKLENGIGTTLLTRHVDGIRLTEEGERVLAAARRMEAISSELTRGDNPISANQGEIKIAVTDGLGTCWICPQLGTYREQHPLHSVTLRSGMSAADVLRLETHLAVQLVRPKAKDLKIVRLGRLHVMLFAASSYIARHGAPKSVADLARHQIIFQDAEQVTPPSEVPESVRNAIMHRNIAIRTNSSMAHYFAIMSGVGVGMLPTYVASMGPSLIPIDIEYRTSLDIWLVYHPDTGHLARIQNMIDWLIDLFSPRRFPWFSDQFVHPNEFRANMKWKGPVGIVSKTPDPR